MKEIKVGYEKSSQILNKDISHKMEIKQQQCDKQILAVKQELKQEINELKSENKEIMSVLVKMSEQVEKIANPPKPPAPEVKDDDEIELKKFLASSEDIGREHKKPE